MILSSLLWVGKNFRRMYQIVPPSIYTLQRLPLQLLVGRVFYLVLLLNWYLAVLRSHKVTWGIVFTPIIFISVYFGTYSVQKICCRRVARLRLSTQFLENKWEFGFSVNYFLFDFCSQPHNYFTSFPIRVFLSFFDIDSLSHFDIEILITLLFFLMISAGKDFDNLLIFPYFPISIHYSVYIFLFRLKILPFRDVVFEFNVIHLPY